MTHNHRNFIKVSVLFEESLYGEGCGEFVVSTLIYISRERGREDFKTKVLRNLMQEENCL